MIEGIENIIKDMNYFQEIIYMEKDYEIYINYMNNIIVLNYFYENELFDIDILNYSKLWETNIFNNSKSLKIEYTIIVWLSIIYILYMLEKKRKIYKEKYIYINIFFLFLVVILSYFILLKIRNQNLWFLILKYKIICKIYWYQLVLNYKKIENKWTFYIIICYLSVIININILFIILNYYIKCIHDMNFIWINIWINIWKNRKRYILIYWCKMQDNFVYNIKNIKIRKKEQYKLIKEIIMYEKTLLLLEEKKINLLEKKELIDIFTIKLRYKIYILKSLKNLIIRLFIFLILFVKNYMKKSIFKISETNILLYELVNIIRYIVIIMKINKRIIKFFNDYKIKI